MLPKDLLEPTMKGMQAGLSCVLAMALSVSAMAGCKSGDPVLTTPVPGTQGQPSGLTQYHEGYRGIDFQYPSSWSMEREEHIPIHLAGKNDCSFYLVGEQPLDGTPAAKNLQELQKEAVSDNPGATFGPRPAWAGSQKPDWSYAMTTMKKGRRVIEYDTTFQHDAVVETLTETMRESDATCAAQMQALEKSFRFYPATPPPAVGSGK